MKRIFIAAFVAAFLALPASGMEVNADWFACKKDTDCVRAEEVCGEPAGVSLKHYKEYAEYLKSNRPLVECAAPRKVMNLRELHSVCQENKCGFDPAPQFGAH